MKKKKAKFELFGTAFLDCICCGFGAVILLFVIVNGQMEGERKEATKNLREAVAQAEAEVKTQEQKQQTLEATLASSRDELSAKRQRMAEIQAAKTEANQAADTTKVTTEETKKMEAELARLEKTIADSKEKAKTQVKSDPDPNSMIAFSGDGDRQYLTEMRTEGERVLFLIDLSRSMLGETMAEHARIQSLPPTEQRQTRKWQQVLASMRWLMAQASAVNTSYQVYVFNHSASALIPGTEGTWLSFSDEAQLEKVLAQLDTLHPDGGANFDEAFLCPDQFDEPPDLIYLLSDGLPTQSNNRVNTSGSVSGAKRREYFNTAARHLGNRIPVNALLYPMENDPYAAPAFWVLACRTQGSFFCPPKDWP